MLLGNGSFAHIGRDIRVGVETKGFRGDQTSDLGVW
jgi:hypothetical protein